MLFNMAATTVNYSLTLLINYDIIKLLVVSDYNSSKLQNYCFTIFELQKLELENSCLFG